MEFKELPKDKVEVINSITSGSPIFIDRWLSFFPAGSEILFDNPQLSTKVVAAGIWTSGALLAPYVYEVVRADGEIYDIDRYLLSASGAAILRRRKVKKDFPEHHSSELPPYYFNTLSGSIGISAPTQ